MGKVLPHSRSTSIGGSSAEIAFVRSRVVRQRGIGFVWRRGLLTANEWWWLTATLTFSKPLAYAVSNPTTDKLYKIRRDFRRGRARHGMFLGIAKRRKYHARPFRTTRFRCRRCAKL